jgi:hypothetical protein
MNFSVFFPASREFRPFRDEFAPDCFLQRRVHKPSVPPAISRARFQGSPPRLRRPSRASAPVLVMLGPTATC